MSKNAGFVLAVCVASSSSPLSSQPGMVTVGDGRLGGGWWSAQNLSPPTVQRAAHPLAGHFGRLTMLPIIARLGW
jgi:hypothetical protein